MADAFQHVIRAYSNPLRHYHDFVHIQNMIIYAHMYGDPDHIFGDDGFLTRPLYHAIMFHDVHYEFVRSGAHSNEELSAAEYGVYAVKKGIPDDEVNRVVDMIHATEHHFAGTDYTDYLTNLLLDLDVLSFAEEHERFQQIQNDIDAEYLNFYPEELVYEKRIAFLTDIYKNKKLRYRVVDPTGVLTEIAYKNLSMYLDM